MNYGLPYKGSKNKIAVEIVKQLPPAEHFYDVFAGGCAIAHAAILSGKYKVVHLNDIERTPQFFVDCINGKLKDEHRVITREEFQMFKDTDLYIALCWSFGNNGSSYLWSPETERIKIEACRMIMADTWQQRRQHYLVFCHILQNMLGIYADRKNTAKQNHQKLIDAANGGINLQRLKRMERLQHGGMSPCQIVCTNLDYRQLTFEPDSVVYADPPYEGSSQYRCGKFDSDEFWRWATSVPNIYVSSYQAPDIWQTIWEKEKRSTYSSANNTLKTVEKLFKNPLNQCPPTTLNKR